MHPKSRILTRLRQAVLAIIVAGIGTGTYAQSSAPPTSLKDLFDAAWAQQPEFQALSIRQDAVHAQRRAAEAWTPEPPAIEVANKTDRFNRNSGVREI